MIAVETNILVYAHRKDSVWHARALPVMQQLAASRRWAIPWPCVHEFISITTRPKVYLPPSTIEQALAQLDAWFASPGIALIGEGPKHFTTLQELAVNGNAMGGRIHDARIAAICIDNGVSELWTADRDFQRFPALKCRNPLVD